MRKVRSLGPSLALLAAVGVAGSAAGRHGSPGMPGSDHHRHHRSKTLLAFSSMFGVDGAFVGDANPLDDIPGDELPWVIDSARGRLTTDGSLFLLVRGVVFEDDESVPPELRGINDEEQFRAAVSCLTDENGSVVRRNVVSEGFPATPEGDALIRAKLTLPDPCADPAVFVLAGSEDKWFAVTGFETEEEDGEE
jgi:hypothetical protein